MPVDGARYLADYLWETPDEDGHIYEVINGELIVSPIPWWDHQYQLSNLAFFVNNWVDADDLGYVVVGAVGDHES